MIYMLVGALLSFGKVNDLPQYYSAGYMLLTGQGGSVYDLDSLFATQRNLFPTLDPERLGIALFLPPMAVPLLIPIAYIPLAHAPAIWMLVLCLCMAIAVALLVYTYKLNRIQTLWFVSLIMLSGACYDSLKVGQLSPFMFLALAISILAFNRSQGIMAGLALSALWLKPQYLIPLSVFLLGAKRWPSLVVIAGSGAVLTTIAVGVMGLDTFHNYAALVSNPTSLPFMQPELTPTLRGQLLRLGVPAGQTSLYATIFMLLSLALTLYIGNRVAGRQNWYQFGLIAVLPLMVLSSFHSHNYDLLLLIPSLLSLSQAPQAKALPSYLVAAGLVLLVPFLLPPYAEIHYRYMLQNGVLNPYYFILIAYSIFTVNFVLKTSRSQD